MRLRLASSIVRFAFAAALVAVAPLALADVRLVQERPDGVDLTWTVAPGAAPETIRLAVPSGRIPALDPADPVAARVTLTSRGWRGVLPTATLRLDPSGLPSGDHALSLSWQPSATPAEMPPSLSPHWTPGAASRSAAGELLNPAGATLFAREAVADRALRAPSPARLPSGEVLPARRTRARAMSLGEDGGVGLPGPLPPSTNGITGGRVKIVIAPDDPARRGGPGLYRITASMLGGLGVTTADIRLADLRLVTLDTTTSLIGQAVVPLRRHDADGDGLFGAADWIEFWGEPMTGESFRSFFQQGDYTDHRAYMLDTAAGSPSPEMTGRDGTPVSATSQDFLATARAERNDLFLNTTRTGEQGVDHFYWCSPDRLSWSSSVGTEARRTESIDLPSLAAGSARRGEVRVRLLHRFGDQAASPDHRSIVDVNARTGVSDRTGDGYQRVDHVATGLVAGTDLLSRTTVTMRAPGVAGANANLFELDWIEVDYPRTFDLDAGRLVFTHEPGWSAAVRPIPDADVTVLDVTDPLDPVVLSGLEFGAVIVRFELAGDGSGEDVRYAVQLTPPGEPALLPSSLSLVPDDGLRNPANVADVLLVGPREWVEASPLPAGIQRWLDLRQSQGLAVRVVSTEAVIDEFGSGTFTPVAVAGLFTEAVSRWARPPRYALLLGDASLDHKNNLAGRILDPSTCSDALDPCGYDETGWTQAVPTRIVDQPEDTQFLGWYASDVAQAIVAGGDSDVDIAVGRLPARTVAEADALLAKVVDYEAAAATRPPWAGRVLQVADRITESSEAPFETFQDEVRDAHVLPRYDVTQLFYQRDFGGTPPEPFTQALLDTWIDPATSGSVLSYVGHGSAYRWSGDDVLLNRGQAPCRNDVDRLAVAGVPAPIIFNSNCITGTFVYPLGPSLLEELVRAPVGGAIAALGPTGVTELSQARDVLNVGFAAMHGRDGRSGRLGDVIRAVQETLAAGIDPTHLFSNAFLGDPSLVPAVPYGPAAISLAATPGDALVDLSWPAVPGASSYALYRSDNGAGGTYRLIAEGVAGTTHRDQGDPPGDATAVVNNVLYHYALEPLDADGFPGKWSARVPARPCTNAVPEPPGTLTVTPGACTGAFLLRWGASATTGLQGYVVRVYRGAVAAGAPVFTRIAPGTFTNVGLETWTEYTFTVSPLTWCNVEGAASNPVTAVSTCPLALDVPAFIPDLRVARTGSDLRLSWSPVTMTVKGDPATIASYRVHRSAAPDFFAGAATTVSDAAPTTFTDPGRVGNGTSLEFYAVGAIDAQGRSGGVGHDLPQGARNVSSTDLGTDVQVNWAPVRRDLGGLRTPILRYEIYNSATAITRSRIETEPMTPVAVVPGPPAVLPEVPGSTFWFVVPVDVHGNRSAD